MKLINLSRIVLVFILAAGCDTENNVEPTHEFYFTKYYGEDGEQEGVDLVRTEDGSLILLGNSFSQTDPISPFIVKTDVKGNIIWQKTFKNNNETAVDVALVNGGSHIAVLSNVQRATTNMCLYILGLDGNLVDSIYVDRARNEVGKSITQSSDNGFLIAGYKDPNPDRNPDLPPPDQADILLLKINNGLDEVLDLSPGGGEHVGSGIRAFEMEVSSDPYFLVFGYSDRPRENASSTYKLCYQLIASNQDGVPTGMHEVSENEVLEEQVAASVLEIPSARGGGYLMVGTSYEATSSALYLTRFSRPLNPNTATKTLDRKIPLGRRIEGVSAANASPDGFFVAGNEVRENNKKDIFLLRVERDGSVVWSTSFGSLDGEDTAGGIDALPDGRIAMIGTIQLETQRKMVLMVMNANGRFSD